MTTLRDALSQALEKAEAGTIEPVHETPIETPEVSHETPEQAEQRARDELGRFTPKQEAKQEAKPEPAAETKPARKPPSSWKKDYWQHWERLGTDPELARLQDYIEERESQAANGVHQYKSQLDQYKPVIDVVQKFLPELQQHGLQPGPWIENLGTAHRMLALGTPEQKLQMFAKLAADYGVPLQALSGQQVDPQFGHVLTKAQLAEQQAARALQAVQEFQNSQLQQQINAFKEGKPHFEAVQNTMSQLLASGVADSLDSAYQKAIRLHDDVWQQIQAENTAKEAAQRAAEVAKKKAAAASPKSVSPTGEMTTGGGKKGLRETLSEAFDNVSGGRL